MSKFDGFLIRNATNDDGTIPRTGPWTASPDIIPAGVISLSQNELIEKWDTVYYNNITEGLTNYFYIRGQNLSSTPITKQFFLFQVSGSLVLYPLQWYKKSHLLLCNENVGGKIVTNDHQQFTVQPNQKIATNAFFWQPEGAEHHCIVAAVADNWDAIQAQFPPSINTSADDLANWIFQNGNVGWHNINIIPMTSTVIEKEIPFINSLGDKRFTFTIVAENVPVGAEVSFSSSSSTSSGANISQGWTKVPPKDPSKNPPETINPDFEVGTTLDVNNGFSTNITYRTRLNGLALPGNFRMHMKVTYTTIPAPAVTANLSNEIVSNLFKASFKKSFTRDALFVHPRTGELMSGFQGFKNSLYTDDDGDDPLVPQLAVVIGSDTILVK